MTQPDLLALIVTAVIWFLTGVWCGNRSKHTDCMHTAIEATMDYVTADTTLRARSRMSAAGFDEFTRAMTAGPVTDQERERLKALGPVHTG